MSRILTDRGMASFLGEGDLGLYCTVTFQWGGGQIGSRLEGVKENLMLTFELPHKKRKVSSFLLLPGKKKRLFNCKAPRTMK